MFYTQSCGQSQASRRDYNVNALYNSRDEFSDRPPPSDPCRSRPLGSAAVGGFSGPAISAFLGLAKGYRLHGGGLTLASPVKPAA